MPELSRRIGRSDSAARADSAIQRRAFDLDLQVDEIALRTRTNPGTVKSRLHHALRALRAAYEAQDR